VLCFLSPLSSSPSLFVAVTVPHIQFVGKDCASLTARTVQRACTGAYLLTTQVVEIDLEASVSGTRHVDNARPDSFAQPGVVSIKI
jgi:hypothetical protein